MSVDPLANAIGKPAVKSLTVWGGLVFLLADQIGRGLMETGVVDVETGQLIAYWTARAGAIMSLLGLRRAIPKGAAPAAVLLLALMLPGAPAYADGMPTTPVAQTNEVTSEPSDQNWWVEGAVGPAFGDEGTGLGLRLMGAWVAQDWLSVGLAYHNLQGVTRSVEATAVAEATATAEAEAVVDDRNCATCRHDSYARASSTVTAQDDASVRVDEEVPMWAILAAARVHPWNLRGFHPYLQVGLGAGELGSEGADGSMSFGGGVTHPIGSEGAFLGAGVDAVTYFEDFGEFPGIEVLAQAGWAF